MSISESLTIQILGDSANFEEALGRVIDQIQDLDSQLSQTSEGVSGLGSAFQSLSAASQPISMIANQIAQLSVQLQALSQQPVTINVAPAMQALNMLIQMAQAAAAQIAAISGGVGGGGFGPMAMGPSMGGGTAVRGYADGGLVSGPAGHDRVPAQLTAGEFVLTRNAVAAIGTERLEQLNSAPHSVALTSLAFAEPNVSFGANPKASPSFLPPQKSHLQSIHKTTSQAVSQQQNHFGGIAIHMKETADFRSVLQDLRAEGIGLRHRRG